MIHNDSTISMTHDQSVEWLLETRGKVSKEKIVNLFLASLSTRKMEWRSGLPALAMSLHFPKHKFLGNKEEYNCPVCFDYVLLENQRQLKLINNFRLSTGGLLQIAPGAITPAYYLDQIVLLENIFPVKEDIIIFRKIIDVLRKAEPKDNPNSIEKKIGQAKIIKSDKYQRREILETLAICGILETNEFKGYRLQFNDLSTREQRSNGPDNDWGYPIRWWKGADGVNEKALEYWFPKNQYDII